MKRPVLVTGAAGFIGAAVALRLLERGERVVGLDNINTYYSPELKVARLQRLEDAAGDWLFKQFDLENEAEIADLFAAHQPRAVVHLAAQAGVRYSIENPAAYIQSNLDGFGNVLEGCRTKAWSIWSMPPVARCMAATVRCRFASSTP